MIIAGRGERDRNHPVERPVARGAAKERTRRPAGAGPEPCARRRFLKTAIASAVLGCAGAVKTQEGSARCGDNRRRLAEWIAGSFAAEPIGLAPNLPSGKTFGGTPREDLKNLYWLQNCNLFAMVALRRYDRSIAERIERSYWKWYREAFPGIPEKTPHYLVLGQLPEIEAPDGQYLRSVVKTKEFEGYTIGTETCDPKLLGRIGEDDPRTLLKHGVLHQCLLGHRERARQYLECALALWNGNGFPDTKAKREKTRGAYHTRNLLYALIAERAMKEPLLGAVRDIIEKRLWACQDQDGGMWTDYLAEGGFPNFAKKTNEIAPLTLLAYDESLWP